MFLNNLDAYEVLVRTDDGEEYVVATGVAGNTTAVLVRVKEESGVTRPAEPAEEPV